MIKKKKKRLKLCCNSELNCCWQKVQFTTALVTVAGIPMTVSILVTGAVCTFYTSLVRELYM